MHSLHGEVNRVHFFISDLKSSCDTDCLTSCGTKVQIFGHKWDRVPVPLQTDWTFCILKFNGLCSLWGVGVGVKMSWRNVGEILCDILYISVARAYKFFWWIDIQLSFSKSYLYENVLSLLVILKGTLMEIWKSLYLF